MPKLISGCVAEFLGTFMLTFFGCLSIHLAGNATAGAGLVTVALAHGLVLFAMIAACMYISGAQFNPAVSVGLVVAGKQSGPTAGAYIASQVLAACCAAGMVVLILTPAVARDPKTTYLVGSTIGSMTTAGQAWPLVMLEAILTFTLMLVILGSTVDARGHKLGGLPIAMTVAACIVAAGPLSGASMNPARTFGPWMYGQHPLLWAYLLGPVSGAVLAAIVYRVFWRGEPAGEKA